MVKGHNADRSQLRNGVRSFKENYGELESRRMDDIGRFRFADLPPGEYQLTLYTPGLPPVQTEVVLVEGDDALHVVLEVQAGLSLEFVLQDSAGNPVPDILCIVSFDGKQSRARTGEDGRAVVSGLPQKEVFIFFSYVMGWLGPTGGPNRVVPADQELLYILEPAAFVRGTVRSPEGEPLPGLEVWAHSSSTGDYVFNGCCDREGRFNLTMKRGTEVDLSLNGRHNTPAFYATEITDYRGSIRNIVAPADDVVLRADRRPRDRSLTVIVEDPLGKRIPGVSVWIHREDDRPNVRERLPLIISGRGEASLFQRRSRSRHEVRR